MDSRSRGADDFKTIHRELERIQREEAQARQAGPPSSETSAPPQRPRAADDFAAIRKRRDEVRAELDKELKGSGPALDASVWFGNPRRLLGCRSISQDFFVSPAAPALATLSAQDRNVTRRAKWR